MLVLSPEASMHLAPNPFPIYPVASLNDIAGDIVNRTVFTESIIEVDSVVQDYMKRIASGAPEGVAIPVRGDYGTGKTHLLAFAKARLLDGWPSGKADVTALLVPAIEAPFSSWYLSSIAPHFSRLNLPRLFVKLLANAATDIAEQVPLTKELADRIRKDPLEV
jgi:hypothetical protein